MRVVNDADTGKFFLHCKAGKHRTGVLGAVYRYENTDGITKSLSGNENYNFTWWLVHGMLKSYVKDYAEEMEEKRGPETNPASPR